MQYIKYNKCIYIYTYIEFIIYIIYIIIYIYIIICIWNEEPSFWTNPNGKLPPQLGP